MANNTDLIDMNVAMVYCGDDMDLFKEVLQAFLQSSFKDNLQNAYEAENWSEYRISIHGLKSAAKAIGAMHMSESAKESELALK